MNGELLLMTHFHFTKGILENSFSLFWKRFSTWCYTNRWPMLLSMLAGAMVHFTIYSNQLLNADSAVISKYYFADHWDFIPMWETIQGRWGLYFIDLLRGGINLAPLSFFLMLLFYTLSGIVLCNIFDIHSRFLRLLIPILIVCSPFVAEIATYHYCSAAYAFSFFLSILSVFFAFRYGVPGCVLSIFTLTISLSLYQANLGTAAGLCVMVLILSLLNGTYSLKTIFSKALHMGVMGIAGTVLYYLILKILLFLNNVQMAGGYSEVVSLNLVKTLPAGILLAYKNFFSYFFLHTIAQNYYHQPAAYLLIFLITLIALLNQIRLLKSWSLLWGILFLGILLPPSLCITNIITPSSYFGLRNAGSLVLVVPFCLSLVRLNSSTTNSACTWKNVLCHFFAICLLSGYIVQVSNDSLVLLTQKNTLVGLANRICVQLEDNSDYLAGAPVCILGLPQNGWYQETSALTSRSSKLVQYGQISPDPVLNSRTWHMFYWDELGISMNWCSDLQTSSLASSQEFAEMPSYPQEGSIQTIDGVVTVKVSPIQ